MKSFVSKEFRRHLNKLPVDVQKRAKRTYEAWRKDPYHPGLGFQRLAPHDAYSVRIGLHYRAVCVRVAADIYLWEWIGSQSDYDKLVDHLD